MAPLRTNLRKPEVPGSSPGGPTIYWCEGMRLWIDLVNLPHVRLFLRLLRKYRKEIGDILISCRRLDALPELINLFLSDYSDRIRVVGSHGISLVEKLSKHLERVSLLAKMVVEFSPNVASSKASPELARVAFGLGIPSVNLNDNDLSFHVSKLIFPLSQTVIVPEVFPEEVLVTTGALDRVRRFKGVTEVAHVLDFLEVPHKAEIEKFKEQYIVARPAPVGASYLYNKASSFSFEKALLILSKRIPNLKIYLFPRGRELLLLSEELGDRIVLVKDPRDSLALMSGAIAFIGASGTMTREAALLGVPSISMFPSDKEPCVTQLLIDEGLIVKLKDPEEVVNLVLQYMKDESTREDLKRKARAFLASCEDPAEVLWEEIRRLSS
ncbi:MAG: hypothetical protein DRN92_07975 [Thermoproteota archaeon]|nr:MAG: hypothetical protein DRN92_07975 [Candidatus Korarchaeota archaeon]